MPRVGGPFAGPGWWLHADADLVDPGAARATITTNADGVAFTDNTVTGSLAITGGFNYSKTIGGKVTDAGNS